MHSLCFVRGHLSLWSCTIHTRLGQYVRCEVLTDVSRSHFLGVLCRVLWYLSTILHGVISQTTVILVTSYIGLFICEAVNDVVNSLDYK